MGRFHHERLDVYHRAVEFAAFASELVRDLPKGQRDLLDQLSRAAASIVLNIAEGSGEFSRLDKLRFYRIARRSATECAAVVDLLEALGLAERSRLTSGRELLDRIVAMLTQMTRPKEQPEGTGDR